MHERTISTWTTAATQPVAPLAHHRRDAGMTLTEVIVVTALLGLITTVLAGAIGVVFRSESGIVSTVAESHDIQQAVNYFHLDVQSGPHSPDAYKSSRDTDRGSGCSDAGDDNVFRYDDGDRRLAYRIAIAGGLASLDRVECAWDGTAWTERSVVNIADALDATGPTVVEADVIDANGDDEVDRVEMVFAQRHGDEVVAATPRAEVGVAASRGDCADDPLEATQNFMTFVEGDVHVDGSQVKQSLAVGGSFSFEGNVSVGQNMNQPSEYPVTPGYTNASLLVGRVDWTTTAADGNGSATLHSGTDGVFVDASNTDRTAQGQNVRVFELGDGNEKPVIKVQNGGVVHQDVSPISFPDAFADLRLCSDLMAALPAGCSCARMVSLTNVNGGPYEGTAANDSVKLVLQPGVANVLNVPIANMDQLHDIKWSSLFPLPSAPLIINVAGGPDLTFTPPQVQGAGRTAEAIVWNFPNVTGTLTITGGGGDGVWGTVFAPYADVVADVKVEGGVVAENLVFSGSSINPSRSFDGTIDWD